MKKSIDQINQMNKNAIHLNFGGIDEILSNKLFLSGDDVASNFNILNEKKITHILNLTTNFKNAFDTKFVYKTIKVDDKLHENIYKHFNESFEFIDTALKDETKRVLVHCNMGVSRSPSFIIAYLLQKRLYTCYLDAYEHVSKCRFYIYPNLNFVKQLIDLEKKLKYKKGS
jgi:protein-tyrosine phosphatase